MDFVFVSWLFLLYLVYQGLLIFIMYILYPDFGRVI
jgi:hypothetical protein